MTCAGMDCISMTCVGMDCISMTCYALYKYDRGEYDGLYKYDMCRYRLY